VSGVRAWGYVAALIALSIASGVDAQDIPDIDYEHLAFRGFGLDWGYIYPDRVEPTATYAARFDLGYAGPGLRIVPSVSYWRSPLEASEITEFTTRIEELVLDQTGLATTLDLGTIEYSDLALGIDGHVVWELPLDVLTFGGLGVTAHFLNGDGAAINGTFIEDLLDSVTAGFNLHLGTEYPVTDRMRVYGVGRYEVLPDLRYFRIQLGWQFMTGPNAPGEGRGG
jgi:hypothetical protein